MLHKGKTDSLQRTQRAQRNPDALFSASPAVNYVSVLVAALIIGGCGSAPKRLERDAGVAAPKPTPSASAPRGSGGYYQDDGPGDNPPANLDQIEDAEPRLEPPHRFANNPYTC